MRKRVRAIVIIFIALVAVGATFLPQLATKTTHANSAESPPVLVILGDSIGTGFGVSGYSASAVQNQTALFGYGRIIRNTRGFEVICRAVDGATTTTMIEHISTHQDTRNDIIRADIINITIGGNDMRYINDIMGSSNFMIDVINEIRTGRDTPMADAVLEHLRGNIATILDIIYGLNPHALIVVLENYAPPFHTVNIFERAIIAAVFGMSVARDPAGLNQAGVTITSRLNKEVWAELATTYRGRMVLSDAFNAMMETTDRGTTRTNKSLFQFDFIHPNSSGHRVLANTLMATIDKHTDFGNIWSNPSSRWFWWS